MFQLLKSCDVKYFPSVVLSEEVLCSETFKQCRDSRVKLKLGKDEGKVEKEEDEEAEAEEEEDEGQVQIGAQLHVPGRERDDWNAWLFFTLQGFFRLGGI